MLIYRNDWVIIMIVDYVILYLKKSTLILHSLRQEGVLKESALCTLVKMLINVKGT